MNDIRTALFRTITYLDLFDFAPTLLELEQWLVVPQHNNTAEHLNQFQDNHSPLSTLQRTLASDDRIAHAEGFYFLRGREQLIPLRKKKYNFTEEKWKHVRPYLRLLASLPHVRAIFLANAMGWSNARRDSDIDLTIVTTPAHIWTARLFTAGLMKLLRQRPGEQSPDRALCLSFYVDSGHLNLAPYRLHDHDVPFAFWVAQQYPVYDAEHLHHKLFEQNAAWLQQMFTHLQWPTSTPRRTITPYLLLRPKKLFLEWLPLERFSRWIQQRLMPTTITAHANKDTRVVINDYILKLHTNDRRQEQLSAWEQHHNETI